MARIVIEGRDKLLMALTGEHGGWQVVKLSEADKKTLRQAVVVLEKAAELWYRANELDEDFCDNPYALAEIEIQCALDD